MLAEMTREEFDERYAQYRLHPWGHESEVLSAAVSLLINTVRGIVGEVPESELLKPDHFLPKPVKDEPTVSTSSYFATMRQQIMRGKS